MKDLNRFIEHTNLKPTLTDNDVDKMVAQVIEHQFVGLCVPPFWVKKASRDLEKQDIQLVTVIGFPLGYQMTETKIEEIKVALVGGADELDIVMNLSAFKSGMTWVKIELAKCATVIHKAHKMMKVIIETAYLNDQEIIEACNLCKDAGADFVKTSTGYAPQGATASHIQLMRQTLPSQVGIKASGGIKTYEDAVALIKAGADRLGTSSATTIMAEAAQV
ncbi:MAG: deoxyribose-phosphate aldolase [Cyclobacteriaceae bacterium]